MVNCSGTPNSYMVPHRGRAVAVLVIVASLGRTEKANDPRSGQFDEPRVIAVACTNLTWENCLIIDETLVLVYLKILVLTACVLWRHWLWQLPRAVYLDEKRVTKLSSISSFSFFFYSDSAPDRHLYPILFFFSLLSFTPVIEPNRLRASLDFVAVVSMIQTRRSDSIYCVIAMIAQLVLSVSIYSVPWKIRPVCSAFLWPRVLVRGISFWSPSRNVNHIVWVKYLDDSAGT